MPTPSDDEIDSAFSDAPTTAKATSSGDDEIDAAFKPEHDEYRPKSASDPVIPKGSKQPELLPMLWEGSKEMAQSALHGAGTLADVATGTYPGKGSHAESWASLIKTDPTLGGQISGQPVISSDDISKKYDQAFGQGPGASELKARIPQAFEAISTAVPALRTFKGAAPVADTQAAMDAAAASGPQSMGAAASAQQIGSLSPGLKQGFTTAVGKTGGAVNPLAAVNHAEADTHGVQLTRGQATRDAAQFSNEQNSTHPQIVKRLNDQNTQMTDALDTIRREAAPGAVQNNHIENGQIAVDSLKAYDEPIKADIDAKYDAARKASANGDLQMDGSSFVNNANAALKPQSKFRFLPPVVQGVLDDVASAKGRMSLDDFQAYSTQLGNEIAKAKRAGDGNAEAAITKVYSALQDASPLGTETAQAKALFDTARQAAKARFDAMRADPAYEAAVEEAQSGVKKGKPSPLADSFLDRYVIGKGAPKANVDELIPKLDPEGREAVVSHTLGAIRKGAITSTGSVSPAGFQAALDKYSPKLGSLVPAQTQESLESLARVVHNVKTPPPGHFVNYSKSGVVMNAARGVGGPLAEAAINAKTFGMGMPILKGISENNFAKRALAPGAGLDDLSPASVTTQQ